jgi:hypothetical protein
MHPSQATSFDDALEGKQIWNRDPMAHKQWDAQSFLWLVLNHARLTSRDPAIASLQSLQLKREYF